MSDGSCGSVIVLKMIQRAPFSKDAIEQPEEHRHARPAKSINGLLRVANDHQFAGRETSGMRWIFRQQGDDFCLHLVGVLEFVNQQGLKVILVVSPNSGMVLQ